MAAALLIFQYVSFETSFDGFHEKKQNIYRLTLGRLSNGYGTGAKSAGAMAPLLIENYAGIKAYVRLRKFPSLVSNGETRVHENQFYFTDSTFFKVFSFKLKEGDKNQILREPNTIVITESTAQRMFGRSSGIVGELLEVDNQMSYRIDGIAEDPPSNSHFDFDYLASIASIANHYNEPLRTYQTNEWYAHYYYTYLELEPQSDPESLGGLILESGKTLSDPENYELYGTNSGLFLQPLTDIHLDPKYGEIEPQGNVDNVLILRSVAIIILLLAIMNYTNLSTAQSIRRIKEVAMRKTLGATRSQLIIQFLTESVLMSIISFALSISIIQLLQSVIQDQLALNADSLMAFYESEMLALIILVLGIGLLGGLYPALHMSSFGSSSLFRDKLSGNRKFIFKKTVIFLQFSISIVLISSTIVVFSQVEFMKNQELGIDTEQIITIPTYGNVEINNTYDRFRLEMSGKPGIRVTSLAELSPGDNAFGFSSKFEGMESNRNVTTICVDYDYIDLYGLKLIEGRNFSRDIASDTLEMIVINEKMCAELGWTPREAIGKSYDRGGDGENQGFVIGVVKDFHFNSLKHSIFPVALTILPNFYQKIAVKIDGPSLGDAIATIENAWSEVYPEWPFDYQIVNQEFDKQYQSENKFGSLFFMFTILGLLIAALGIYGLVLLMTELKRKELSIRKVLGAQTWSLIQLLSKEYVTMMLLAFVLCAPLSYFLMENWLTDFAYRIPIQWWMMAVSLLVITVICSGTIGMRIYKSVKSNPVDSLRYE